MTKKTILIHKMLRAYKNPKNWEYSRFKGYPEGTYFGYSSFDEMKKSVVRQFVEFYGKGLRRWNTIKNLFDMKYRVDLSAHISVVVEAQNEYEAGRIATDIANNDEAMWCSFEVEEVDEEENNN